MMKTLLAAAVISLSGSVAMANGQGGGGGGGGGGGCGCGNALYDFSYTGTQSQSLTAFNLNAGSAFGGSAGAFLHFSAGNEAEASGGAGTIFGSPTSTGESSSNDYGSGFVKEWATPGSFAQAGVNGQVGGSAIHFSGVGLPSLPSW